MKCPTCGQPWAGFRLGVRLPPVKLRIFDAVHAAGDIGVKARDLIQIVYEGEKKPTALETIRNHIRQMNDILVSTDFEVVTHDRRHWLLARRKKEKGKWDKR